MSNPRWQGKARDALDDTRAEKQFLQSHRVLPLRDSHSHARGCWGAAGASCSPRIRCPRAAAAPRLGIRSASGVVHPGSDEVQPARDRSGAEAIARTQKCEPAGVARLLLRAQAVTRVRSRRLPDERRRNRAPPDQPFGWPRQRRRPLTPPAPLPPRLVAAPARHCGRAAAPRCPPGCP
jgi:hypothetical protein